MGGAQRDASGGPRGRFDSFWAIVDPGTPQVVLNGQTVRAGSGLAWHGYAAPETDLLEAYRTFGDVFPNHVPGQFAGLLYDLPRRRFLLFQDSLGLRTLYYGRHAQGWFVSSRLGPAVEACGANAIDEAFIADYLAGGGSLRGRTPYRGIRQLTLGRVGVLEEGGVRLRSVYSLGRSFSGAVAAAPPQEQLAEKLTQAARRAIEPPKRHLCLFSGGLDSTTVLALARREGADVTALTLISGAALSGDDEQYAFEAAETLAVPQVTIDHDRFAPLTRLDCAAEAFPRNQYSFALHQEQRRVVESGPYEVILTGDGGDLVFGSRDVEPFALGDGLAAGSLGRTVAACRLWSRHAPARDPWTHFFWTYAVPGWLNRLLGRRISSPLRSPALPDWLSRDFLRRSDLAARSARSLCPREAPPGAQYLWEELLFQAYLDSVQADRHPGCSIRHPLFDRPLVEFMLALDPDWRRAPALDRRLHRQAVAGLVPENVRTRRTKGGGSAHREIAFLTNPALIEMLTADPLIAQAGWVDLPKWRRAVERARFGVVDRVGPLQTAVSLELWLRNAPQPFTPMSGSSPAWRGEQSSL